jgi:diguanylate cyclase (GGDEF)-like protein
MTFAVVHHPPSHPRASSSAPPSMLVPESMVVPKAALDPGNTLVPVSSPRSSRGLSPSTSPSLLPAFAGRGARWLDPLYGIPLASYFDQRLSEELSRAGRHRRPLSVVVFRLSFGTSLPSAAERAVEEAMLTMVAGEIRRTCREFDVVCRRDHTDLGVILPETARFGALAFVQRITRLVQRAWLETEPAVFGVRPELHHGIGSCHDGRETPFEMMIEAEEALLLSRTADVVRDAA